MMTSQSPLTEDYPESPRGQKEGRFKDEYALPRASYTLRKVGGTQGDSGSYVTSVGIDESGRQYTYAPNKIEVGKGLRCGSHVARSYQYQDWWQTSPVVEFLEVEEDAAFFKFKTRSGSTYILSAGRRSHE